MKRKVKSRASEQTYRIDFALTVLTGNETRYLLQRPLVESDPSVESRWYPIRTWVRDDPLRFLPGHVRLRVRHLLDAWRLFVRPPADAIVMHTFEIYWMYVLLSWLLRRDTVIVDNPDGWRLPRYPWLRRLVVRKTDLFAPWSNFTAEERLAFYPDLPPNDVLVLHPGIDLTRWPMRTPPPPAERFRLLFVGGDLTRKGADTLLDAFDQFLSTTCDVHLATQSAWLKDSPELERRIRQTPNVTLHLDLQPGSPELQNLYRTCDAFVLPTNGDTSSWVGLEALATGIPVIITPYGGIPDIVRDGETGLLIPARDPAALARAVDRLRLSRELRDTLVTQGRAHVEEKFDARKNTARFLSEIKSLIDARREYRQTRSRSAILRESN